MKVIPLIPDELKGDDADQYEVVGTKSTYRLSQRPASYVVLQYNRQVVKKKGCDVMVSSPVPFNVLDKSIADVSFLVGLLVDKFQYHLPLCWQHQRLTDAGITLSRTTLTNVVRRAIDLLYPIADAQLASILESKVLAMDDKFVRNEFELRQQPSG